MIGARAVKKSPTDTDAASCARRILEIVPEVMRQVRSEMRRETGETLSVPQFRMLAFLGRNEGASLSAVASFIGVADATASAAVERLVRRGLVVREGDPHERRRVRLHLTGSGTTLLERARTRTQRRVSARLATLGVAELAHLAHGLDLLRRALSVPVEPTS